MGTAVFWLMQFALYASLAITAVCVLITIILHSIPTSAEATYAP